MMSRFYPAVSTFLLFFSLACAAPLFGDDDPLSLRVPTLWSTEMFGVVGLPGVRDTARTPHLSAYDRETIITAHGGGYTDDGTVGGALGLTVPLARAVASGRVAIGSDASGSVTRVGASLSRPVGPRLSAGAHAGIHIVGDERGEGGFGAGLGVSAGYQLGRWGELSRIELFGALHDAGFSASRRGLEPIIAPFTGMVGVRARLVESGSIAVDAAGAFALEQFSTPHAEAGLRISFGSRIAATLGWRSRIAAGGVQSWPGLSLAVAVSPDAQTRAGMAAQPLTGGGAFVGGFVSSTLPSVDTRPPDVSVSVRSPATRRAEPALTLPIPVILSPARNEDQLLVAIGVVDERAVGEIVARVVRPGGNVVREWRLAPAGRPVPAGDVASRLSQPLEMTSFSAEILWSLADGPDDGLYIMQIAAYDEAGNETTTRELSIEHDRTPPDLSVRWDGARGDAQDELRLLPNERIEGTIAVREAQELTATVRDQANRVVRELQTVGAQTNDEFVVQWQGAGDGGERLPAGVYRIVVSATDRAGNRREVESPAIVVVNAPPAFDLAVDRRRISPIRTDGGDDTIQVRPAIAPIVGLTEWEISLEQFAVDAPSEPRVVARWSGIDLPPEVIRIGSDRFPEDGTYRLVGRTRYEDGNTATRIVAPIIVDRVPPSVEIALSRASVSPEGGRSILVFFEGSSDAVAARLVVAPSDGARGREETVVRFAGLPDTVEWNAVGSDGAPLPSGTYDVWAVASDAAGNERRSESRTLEIVPRLTGVDIIPSASVVSPNGDGRQDSVDLFVEAGSDGGVREAQFESYTVGVRPEDQEGPVWQVNGTGELPASVRWDGRGTDRLPVPDGTYRAFVEITQRDGQSVSARSTPLRIDTTPPAVQLELTGASIVSPDGDGRQDDIALSVLWETREVETVTLVVRDDDGNERSRVTIDAPGEQAIAPRDSSGSLLADGQYQIIAVAVDDAGNVGESLVRELEIDTRPVSGFVRISRAVISPNGDGIADDLVVEPVLTDRSGLSFWSLTVVGPDGTVDEIAGDTAVTTADTARPDDDGERTPSGVEGRTVSWPSAGSDYIDGPYTFRLEAHYRHGPVVDVVSPPVAVDTTPPEVTVALAPPRFSPDDDGRDDTVSFLPSIRDASETEYWLLQIFDPQGQFFFDAGGRGAPPRAIRWDGRATNGERVLSAERYRWEMEVSDRVGNTTSVTGELEVDIMVERFGDGYRIQIPSITFPPNEAVLEMDGSTPQSLQNQTVISRIADVLRRFPDYDVVVEGHAVNLSGTEVEQERELIPLSQARAEAVRAALIARGVAASSLRAEGRGGALPIVPHNDEENRWKNRRVDFVLIR